MFIIMCVQETDKQKRTRSLEVYKDFLKSVKIHKKNEP